MSMQLPSFRADQYEYTSINLIVQEDGQACNESRLHNNAQAKPAIKKDVLRRDRNGKKVVSEYKRESVRKRTAKSQVDDVLVSYIDIFEYVN